MPASASAATSFGCVSGLSLMQARSEVSRYSAMPPSRDSPGNALCSQCMSSPARLDAGDAGADLVHPAGVLVAQGVGQRGLHGRVPLALDDMQVGPADTGAA